MEDNVSRKSSMKINIECDTTELDSAIEKIRQLNKALERTIELKTKLNDDRQNIVDTPT